MNKNRGFTIVELLVVIVVIGVLAAITIVSYTGLSNRAIVSSIQSDLSVSSKQFKLFTVEHGSYPVGNATTAFDSNNCPLKPTGGYDTKYCLKLSGGNIIDEYTGTTNSYSLVIRNGNNVYEITDNSQPASIVPVPLTAASITGTAEEDSILTATTTPAGAAATAAYQWQRADNSTFTTNLQNIGTNSTTYTLVTADVNKHIRVRVTGTSRFPGNVNSAGVGPVISPWITLGTQTWGRYNLNVGIKVDTYVCGSYYDWNIEQDRDLYCIGASNNSVVEKECYNNLESNCTTYGALYSWNEMMQYSSTPGTQGVCPAGSHIPTDAEWKTLEVHLGMTQATADMTGWRGAPVGTSLRSGGSSGFNALLGGLREVDTGSSSELTYSGLYWTSSSSGASTSWIRIFNPTVSQVHRSSGWSKDLGVSVRCLKN